MYQALARKYRPQTWGEVIGQDHVTQTLQNAVVQQRLHHAYLFCGARGVGKTTVARLLAKTVNCVQRGASSEPCNACESCREITNGHALDVQEIDGASNTGVDDVREIRERIQYLPAETRYKVYIIDEVHMLSKAAFNALLKTLEEPPPHVLFIFATTEPQKIPATILSRCQRYDFRRVAAEEIVSTLRHIATAEGMTVGDDLLHLLAYEAEGGLRDAESLFDQVIAACGTAVTVPQVRNLLGLTDRIMLLELVRAIVKRDAKTALGHLETAFQSGGNLPQLAHDLLEFFRHLWVRVSCGELPHRATMPTDEVEAVETLACGMTVEEGAQWFAILFRGIDSVIRGRFPKLAMEAVLLQMVQVTPMTSISALIDRVEAMLATGAGTQTPTSAATMPQTPTSRASAPSAAAQGRAPINAPSPAPSVAGSAEASAGEPGFAWNAFFQKLRRSRPQLASIVEHGHVQRADVERVELRFPRDSLYAAMLQEADRLAQFEALVHEQFGSTCRVQIRQIDGLTSAERQATVRAERQKDQHRRHSAALEHALVREAGEVFGAEIAEVKVYGEST
ncbi:MAG: DNA polymerase III subunit gamma/tau [Deltaproteobacteria bacterium]|nr:DNA polymerase III subunit gamma/tau [Deltaproteobacteria bacterium]